MLPREHRLQKKKDIIGVLRRGKAFRAGPFSLRMLTNKQPFSRLAVIIGREVDKRSTRRNRLKRVIRAALRGFIGNIKPGFDIVIRLHRDEIGSRTREATRELEILFKKATLFP